MLKLSETQCARMDAMEDEDLVRDMAKKLKLKFPGINEPDEIFNSRLKKALAYATIFPLKGKKAKQDFLMLEAFYPGFYLKPEIDKWLKTPNGYSVEQRLEDFKHVMINKERRGL